MRKFTLILILLSVTIFSFAQMNVDIVATNYDLCLGDSSVLTANVSGGTQPHTYLWSDSSTTPSITVYPTPISNDYSVTVTDNNSASNSAQTSLTVDEIRIDSIQVNQVGDSITLTSYVSGNGMGGTYTLLWSTGEHTGVITVSPTTMTTYCLTMTDAFCMVDSCINVNPINSLNENHNFNSLNLFPNPATDKITIENKSNLQQDFLIKLQNVQGQDLFNKSIIIDKTYTIDVSRLDSGFYIMTLQDDNTYYKFKTIIKK